MGSVGGVGRFEPVHDAHAIEQLTAVIQFATHLPNDALLAAANAMAEFKDALPATSEMRGVEFQLGQFGMVPIGQHQGGIPDGFLRRKVDERAVVLKELRIDRQTLAFQTQVYTRWDAVWAEAQTYFARLLPMLGGVGIASFGLHYIDKFRWTGDPATCSATPLFKVGSPYLTPRSPAIQDLWHCYSGRFERVAENVKRHEAVNIDVLDEPRPGDVIPPTMQRIVRILTSLTDRFNEAGYVPRALTAAEAVPVAQECFPALHDELKKVFSEIISDEYGARVGLNNVA